MVTIEENIKHSPTQETPTFARNIINNGDVITIVLRNQEIRTGVATVTELRNVTAVSIDQGDVANINHTLDYEPDLYDVMEIRHTPYGQSGEYAFRNDTTGGIGVYQNYVCIASYPPNFTAEDARRKLQKAERYILQCKKSTDPECQQSIRFHRSIMKASMYRALLQWML